MDKLREVFARYHQSGDSSRTSLFQPEDAEVLSAYAYYLLQFFSEKVLVHVFEEHAEWIYKAVLFFRQRFQCDQGFSITDQAQTAYQLERELTAIPGGHTRSLLEVFYRVLQATVRTNFYVPERETLCLKIIHDPDIPGIPSLPGMIEMVVYAPQFRGIHLRSSAVARGGIRWSDRADLRRELFQLLRTQSVKNAIIVPSGGKGAFFVVDPPLAREDFHAFGVSCYQKFVRSLLSITDNRVGTRVTHPECVRCYDGEDCYFVVAADKGTATFSDYANAIAIEKMFWLGDAFASGGSAGYDHKKMKITALGTWVSVHHHFRRLGIDPRKRPITVVGVGDMWGDVFGNGMLIEKNIRLLGAFDHRHIFIDPDPDCEASYKERERLARIPHSLWSDYDRDVLSEGGGVFARTDIEITLTPEMQRLLNTDEVVVSADEIIRLLLKIKVDLLWLGGIGTFVKAEEETDEMVGDPNNDAIRIVAPEVGARVVGEGANLGFTQKGRIQYALRGGHLNTDAIDNCGGVNCSDHEVNLKILFRTLVQEEKLSIADRNVLLSDLKEDVVGLVLRHNHWQNLIISFFQEQGIAAVNPALSLIDVLESEGIFSSRVMESLPTREDMKKRSFLPRPGMTRPELSVLLSYGKTRFLRQLKLVPSGDEAIWDRFLTSYFPLRVQKEFSAEIRGHLLSREITLSVIANRLVNLLGPFLPAELESLSENLGEVISLHLLALYEALELDRLVHDMEAFFERPDLLMPLFFHVQELARRLALYMLRSPVQHSSLEDIIGYYRDVVEQLKSGGQALLSLSEGFRAFQDVRQGIR